MKEQYCNPIMSVVANEKNPQKSIKGLPPKNYSNPRGEFDGRHLEKMEEIGNMRYSRVQFDSQPFREPKVL